MVRVFDLVLETTTKNFLNWLMSEIDLPIHAYGMKTEVKSPEGFYYDKMFYIGNRRIVPPSSEWPHTCYVADGYLLSTATFAFPRARSEKKPQFDEIKLELDTAKDVEELGPVVRIEVREISENRTEVIGWCGDYAHLRPSMEDLRIVISEIFLLARSGSMRFPAGIGDSSSEPNDFGPPGVEKPDGTMWTDTSVKLDRLRELRREEVRNGRPVPTWTAACGLASIDTKTVIRHNPELRKRWYEEDYDMDV